MTKIKIGELKNAIKKNEAKSVKIVKYNDLEIEIKQYLPIENKIALAKSIYESVAKTEDGLQVINKNSLNIAQSVLMIEFYTNLTLPKDTIEAYDLIISSGIYDFIIDGIEDDELDRTMTVIKNYFESEKEEFEQRNNFIYTVKTFLNNLPSMDKMMNTLEEAKKEINSFSPDNVKFVQEFLKVNKGDK